MPIAPMTTLHLDTAVSASFERARLMCWNAVSRSVVNADGVGVGHALAERSMR